MQAGRVGFLKGKGGMGFALPPGLEVVMREPEQDRPANDNAGNKDEDERRTVPEVPGAARIRDARAGRTAELRGGERFRGDLGGGPRGDGIPNVPHGFADEEAELEAEAAKKPPRRG
jgi:hypothetical protein